MKYSSLNNPRFSEIKIGDILNKSLVTLIKITKTGKIQLFLTEDGFTIPCRPANPGALVFS